MAGALIWPQMAGWRRHRFVISAISWGTSRHESRSIFRIESSPNLYTRKVDHGYKARRRNRTSLHWIPVDVIPLFQLLFSDWMFMS
jgi:hypothetical protein